jgi:hypothetical protein
VVPHPALGAAGRIVMPASVFPAPPLPPVPPVPGPLPPPPEKPTLFGLELQAIKPATETETASAATAVMPMRRDRIR